MKVSENQKRSANVAWLRKSCIGALAVSLCYPISAMAQTTGATDSDAVVRDSSKDDEIILVTARRKSEDIQSVPIAISVLSADDISDSRVYDVARIGELVPGVISGGSQQRGGLIIRGITTRTPEAGADSVVGQYIDDIYQPRITSQFTALFDLDHIEVLKGPQGTLYGRNTIGGVVNYVTRRPGQKGEGYFNAGFGNRGLYELRAGISGPLTPNLAAGISTMIRSSDGNIDVVDAGGSIIGDDGSSDRGVRLALNWTPTDRLEVNASAFTLRMRGASLDMVDGLPAGVIGPIIAGFGLYVPSPYVDDNRHYRIARTTAGRLARDTTEAALRIDLDLSDTMTLTSLTAYQNYDFELVNDLDYDVQQIEQFQTTEEAETFSQEVRLTSDGDIFDWTVGAYYFFDDLTHVDMDDFTGSPVAFIVNPPFPSSSSRVKTTSMALFGQSNFSITDDLTLTTGIRYSYDERDYRKINAFQFPGFENFDSADRAMYPFWDTDPSWDNISYLISLDYQITPDVLLYASHSTGYRSGGIQGRSDSALQASANYDPEHATQYEIGLKSTLFDGRMLLNIAAYHIDYRDAQINQIPLNSPFDVIRNAAGARFQGVEIESRFNVTDEFSLHLAYTYNDSEFTNFSDAEDVPGIIAVLDFDGDGIPDCPSPAYGCAVGDHVYDGVDFEFAVKHAFIVAADYDGQLSDDIGLSLHAEYAWRDSHLLTPLPQNLAARSNAFLNSTYLRQSSYGLFNASASLNIGESWNIGIWGRNLTNERYLTQGGDPQPAVNGFPFQTFLQGDRRTYGLTVGWRY